MAFFFSNRADDCVFSLCSDDPMARAASTRTPPIAPPSSLWELVPPLPQMTDGLTDVKKNVARCLAQMTGQQIQQTAEKGSAVG